MKISEKGVAFIAAHEGVVTKAYRDVKGVWTIGIGHTAAAGAPKPVSGMRITRDEALVTFIRDLGHFESRVAKVMPNSPQHVFDAATSFDFNTGAIHRASWVRLFLAREVDGARSAFLSWNRPRAIRNRRRDEGNLLFDGMYGSLPDMKAASVSGANLAESTHPDDVLLYQTQLAKLGYYDGPLDGSPGPLTKEAALAYQRSHPDLVDDGVVGPATRASLARDAAAIEVQATASKAAAATAVGSALTAASIDAPNWGLWAIGSGVVTLVATAGYLTFRYRDEIARLGRQGHRPRPPDVARPEVDHPKPAAPGGFFVAVLRFGKRASRKETDMSKVNPMAGVLGAAMPGNPLAGMVGAIVADTLRHPDVPIAKEHIGAAAARVVDAVAAHAEAGGLTLAPVKSGWLSKINWVQFAGPLCSLLAAFGLALKPDELVGLVVAVQTVQAIATWIIRTWFTRAVTRSATR